MATSNILIFCPDGTEQAGDIISDAAYLGDAHRLRGNQPGIARRELVNKALKQSSVMAAALGQFIATKAGVNVTDGTPLNTLSAAIVTAVSNSGSGGGGTSGDYVPIPTSSYVVPVTAWTGYDTSASVWQLKLPAGGTWAFHYWFVNDFTNPTATAQTAGVSAGGTTVYSGPVGNMAGWAWRVL